jgi:NitT/TauT family transport system substrate-binding protein
MLHYHIRRLLGASLLAVTVGLGACTSSPTAVETEPAATEESAESAEAPAAETQELTPVSFSLSWLLQGVDAGLTTAIDRGYFAEEGLDVTFERGFGSADSITKIAAGQYDIGEGDIYAMIEFNEKNPDQELVAVAIKFNRSPLSIVSLGSSEITEPSLLEGKTIGAPAGDSARRLFPVFASVTGIDETSVTWANVEPKLRETLLAQGEYDAASCFSTSCIPPLGKAGFPLEDLNVFYYNDYGLDLYGNAIIVRRDYLEANPDIVRGFVAAYLRGTQDMIEDTDAAFATIAQFSEAGVFDEETERYRLDLALDSLILSPEVEENGLGGIDPARLETTIAQVVEGFGLSNTPAVETVFDDSFLPPAEDRMLN